MRWVAAFVLVLGCRYERSICDESPGSGCSGCLASCDDVHRHDPSARAECRDECSEGRWTFGWPPRLPP